MTTMMTLLAISSAFTALVTEAVKKMIGNREYRPNILAAVVSIIVSGLLSAGWIVLCDVAVDPKVVVRIVALVILSWLTAMVGYDKVKQTILQLKEGGAE